MPPKLKKAEDTGRLNVTAPHSLIQAVEEWRIKQRPVMNRAKAVRTLIEIAFAAEKAGLK